MSTTTTAPVEASTTSACPTLGAHQVHPLTRGGARGRLWQCRGCGLVGWTETWTAAQARQHYAGYYHPVEITYDPLTEQRYHAFLSECERLTPGRRLLDIGCGAGHLLAVSAARGWQATGVEVSSSALEALDRLQRERGVRFTVVSDDLARASLPAGRMDVVSLVEVIEHLGNPLAALQESHRLLSDRGLLYLTTPNYDSVSRRLLGCRWRVIAPEHQSLLSPRTLRTYLQAAGFRPLRMTTKNIDVVEILAKWRRQAAPPAGQTRQAAQGLRHAVEERAWLRGLKHLINGCLRWTQLGDTIEVLAMKEPPAHDALCSTG